MPRARANIKAKLRAQIDTGVTLVVRTRAPAATIRPAMVSMSGRPAATRLPKAITKMTIVTGHDSISERNMALRLTALKSAHRALSPVRVTEMPGRDRCWRGPASVSAAGTMALGPALAPAVMTPVLPSAESDTPGWGGTTTDTRGSARSSADGLGHHGLRRGVGGERGAVVDDDDLQGGCAQATKLLLDDLSGLDRLAGRVLPAGPGQGVLDLGGESAEEQQHRRPGQEHDPKVAGAPNPEPGQLAAGRPDRDARSLTNASPLSRVLRAIAIRVKCLFSHNSWFGFMGRAPFGRGPGRAPSVPPGPQVI